MSLRQPVSVPSSNLKLPSGEELAKRESIAFRDFFGRILSDFFTDFSPHFSEAQRVRLDSMDAEQQREFEDEGYTYCILYFDHHTLTVRMHILFVLLCVCFRC